MCNTGKLQHQRLCEEFTLKNHVLLQASSFILHPVTNLQNTSICMHTAIKQL